MTQAPTTSGGVPVEAMTDERCHPHIQDLMGGKSTVEFLGSALYDFQEATGFDTAEEYLAALSSAPSVPKGEALTVTQAMVDAYLKANDAYWKRTDELPKPPDKWRTGTVGEATRVSLEAALAASAPADQGGNTTEGSNT